MAKNINTKEEATFTYNGTLYTAELRRNDYREGTKKMVAYVWPAKQDETADDSHLHFLADAVYESGTICTHKGECPMLDKAWKRFERAEVEDRRNILEAALVSLTSDFGDRSYRWSRTAGCKCGCSSGFILDEAWRGYTIFINPVKEA